MGPVFVQVGLFLFLLSFALSFVVVVSLYSSWLARTSPGTLFHVAVAHPHCTCSLLVFLLQGYKATGSSESPQSRYSVGLGVCKATIIHKNTNQSGQTAGKACSGFLHKPCIQYVATLSVFPW